MWVQLAKLGWQLHGSTETHSDTLVRISSVWHCSDIHTDATLWGSTLAANNKGVDNVSA